MKQSLFDTIISTIVNFFVPDNFDLIIIHLLNVLLICITGYLLSRVLKMLVGYSFSDKRLLNRFIDEKRRATMRQLAKSISMYAVICIVIVTVLGEFGVSAASILAGAGVVGIAVGFGAQGVIRDLFSGFFILAENQFSVGDFVRIGLNEGFVEGIGLRSTVFVSYNGELHIIPNGLIGEVVNLSRRQARAIVDVDVSLENDGAHVLQLAAAAVEEALKDHAQVEAQPEVLGIHKISGNAFTVRITVMTKPLEQWNIQRYILSALKTKFDAEGVIWKKSNQINQD